MRPPVRTWKVRGTYSFTSVHCPLNQHWKCHVFGSRLMLSLIQWSEIVKVESDGLRDSRKAKVRIAIMIVP